MSKCRLERKRLTVVGQFNLCYDHGFTCAVKRVIYYDTSITISNPTHAEIQVAREIEAAHHPQIIVLLYCVVCIACIRETQRLRLYNYFDFT